MAKLNFEQKAVVMLPLLIGLVWPIFSYVFGKLVMRGVPISKSLASLGYWLELANIFLVFALIPFAVLSFYLSSHVMSNSRKKSYGVLIGGVSGIILLYLPIEWMILRPYGGGGANIGLGLLALVKPMLGIFSMMFGVFVGKLTTGTENKKI